MRHKFVSDKLLAMAQQSRLYRMIEARIDGTLAEFIAARRPQMGWRSIAKDIDQRTGIWVSGETLRLWFADRVTVETVVTVG